MFTLFLNEVHSTTLNIFRYYFLRIEHLHVVSSNVISGLAAMTRNALDQSQL